MSGTSSSGVDSPNPRRKALMTAVSSLCIEVGFDNAEKAAVESLTEMLQSCLTEIGRTSHAFCELAGRTEAIMADVVMALVDLGLDAEALPAYAKRSAKSVLPTMSQGSQLSTQKILQAGQKRPHPSHIPDHLPPFPDPHAYIRTPTYKQPVTEYEAIREKAASQKRDVERALTRFIAKTGETHTLFADDTNMFPLITCKHNPHPYLHALLPKDQVFDEDEGLKESPVKKARPAELQGEDEMNESTDQRKDEVDPEGIDNPYLRPIKMPKKRRR